MAAGFLRDSFIDNADGVLQPRDDHLHGWLLFSSTTTHTKMNLSKPLPPPPSARPVTPRRSAGLATYHPSFNYPEDRFSTSSESSDPGLVDDRHWSGSDTTMEERQSLETDLWDSDFWSNEKTKLLPPSHHPDQRPYTSIQGQNSNLTLYNRNFASSNLSGLNVNECPAELRRSDATRTPRRAPNSPSHNIYSAFPVVHPPPRYDSAHKSWPLRDDSYTKTPRPILRARANTTPANCKPLEPSNLSTCSTLDDQYSPTHSTTSSASGLYMRSSPVSPDFEPLMNLMEKSYFDDDSDDEESKLITLATRLHIRSSSANSPPPSNREKALRSQKSRRNLKSAGDAFFKGMFGLKKTVDRV